MSSAAAIFNSPAIPSALLEANYDLELRGEVEIKGKGTMRTRWLTRRAPAPAQMRI